MGTQFGFVIQSGQQDPGVAGEVVRNHCQTTKRTILSGFMSSPSPPIRNVNPVPLPHTPVMHDHGTPLPRLGHEQRVRHHSRRQKDHLLIVSDLGEEHFILRLPISLENENPPPVLNELR